MAVTVKGFQGTLSDTDLASQFPHHGPAVYGPGDLAVSAVANARSVSVAAGSALAPWIRYTSDAAQTVTLAPPASGGKWYAITLNRQWSPTATCVLQADDLAVTDANGTSGSYPSNAALQAAAALPNQPGTAGSTAGQRQVLALVYVRAADTALVIHDMRMTATAAGTLQVLGFPALQMNNLRHLKDGAVIVVGQHTMPGGGTHVISTWRRVLGGGLFVLGDIVVNDGATNPNLNISTQSNSMSDIRGIAVSGLAPNIGLLTRQTMIYEQNTASRWTWNNLGDNNFHVWDWTAIPLAAYGQLINSANVSAIEASVAAGIITVGFSGLSKAGGMGQDTGYFAMLAGGRPAYEASGSGFTTYNNGGSRAPAAVRCIPNGQIMLTTNGGINADNISATIQYRLAA